MFNKLMKKVKSAGILGIVGAGLAVYGGWILVQRFLPSDASDMNRSRAGY